MRIARVEATISRRVCVLCVYLIERESKSKRESERGERESHLLVVMFPGI